MSVLLYGAGVVLLVFALIDILTKGDDQVRGLPKFAWVLLVVLVPVVGSIVWFAVGHDWAPVTGTTDGTSSRTATRTGTPRSVTRAAPTVTSA